MATMNQFTTQAVELAHSRGLDETRGVTIQVDNSVKRTLDHFDCSCLKCKAVEPVNSTFNFTPLLNTWNPICLVWTLILSVFQAVLSYCTQTGDRRTRVHTLTLGCSRHLRDIFRQYQAQTLLTFYCKKSKLL